MRTPFASRFLRARAAAAGLALVAGTFMAGGPLLHGAAHHPHADHPHESAVRDEIVHSEHHGHAPELHEEALRSARGVPVAVLPAAPGAELALHATIQRPGLDSARSATVRAPFPEDPARAPPVA